MPRPWHRARMRTTLPWPASLAATALLSGLLGCDKADNDWHQPGEPHQGAPDLTLGVAYQSVTGDRVRVGEPVSYAVTLANEGTDAADGVVVAVTLPPLVTLDRAMPNRGGWDTGTRMWSAGRVDAATAHTLVLEATVDGAAVGQEIVFTATIASMEPADASPDDNHASVRFSVINRPPRAGDDAYTLSEGASLSIPAPGLLANDLDDEGEAVTLDTVPIAAPRHGQLTILASGAFTYVHDGNEAPADSFLYAITDESAERDTAVVRLSIEAVNDPPVVAALPNQSVQVGGSFLPIPLDSYVTDPDHDAADIQWTTSGEGVLLVSINDDRVLTVRAPSEAWVGAITMTVRATDPEGSWAQRSVRFEVTEGRR